MAKKKPINNELTVTLIVDWQRIEGGKITKAGTQLVVTPEKKQYLQENNLI